MFLNKNIHKLKPYKVTSHKAWELSDSSSILKLDWNESTIPSSPKVTEEITKFLASDQLNWYPNVCNTRLKNYLACYADLSTENVEYFASSDSLHEYILRAFLNEQDDIVMISPTYDNFRAVAESFGATISYYSLLQENDFNFNLDDFVEYLINVAPKIVYICNPNNPTGTTFSNEEIEFLVRRFNDVLFIIDEAYYEFTGITSSHLVNDFENVVICRTFSKAFGLASIRFGYVLSSKNNVIGLSKIRNPKSVSTFAQVAATGALMDLDYMRSYVNEVNETKAFFVEELEKRNFIVSNSQGGNFVFVKLGSDCNNFVDKLEDQNIFIRSYAHVKNMSEYARITVGTRNQMEVVLNAIDRIA